MRESVVMAADILGYKSLIKDAHENGKEQERLQWIDEKLEEAYENVGDPSGAKWVVKTFSDNLIVGYPFIGAGNGAFEIPQACFNVAHVKLGLVMIYAHLAPDHLSKAVEKLPF